MSTVIEKIENILTNKFDMNNYVALIQEIFSTAKFVAPDKIRIEKSNFSSHIYSSTHVANYETPDGSNMVILLN